MSRASEYAINLFRQTKGPLRCLAASDPCNRRNTSPPPAEVQRNADPAPKKPTESAQ